MKRNPTAGEFRDLLEFLLCGSFYMELRAAQKVIKSI